MVDAHIVAASMKHLSLKCPKGEPQQNQYMGDLTEASDEQKKHYLNKCVTTLVNQFALHHAQPLSETAYNSIDGIFDYACSVIGLGQMARNFSDATKEGDGDRLIRCWKFFMLHFKANGRPKYAVEAFNLPAQINATLTPQMSHMLVYNRTCNFQGGEGSNISLDLHNEHINRAFKDGINTFRSNISDSSVARSSQALGPMTEMLKKVDLIAHVKKPSGRHVGPTLQKDFEAILKVLVSEKVFCAQEGRAHKQFTNFSCGPLSSLKKTPVQFQKWLVKRPKAATIEYRIAIRYY